MIIEINTKEVEAIYNSHIANNISDIVQYVTQGTKDKLYPIYIKIFGDSIIKGIDPDLIFNYHENKDAYHDTLVNNIKGLLYKFKKGYKSLPFNTQRMAEIYIQQNCKSIKHLIESLILEFGEEGKIYGEYDKKIITRIITKQIKFYLFMRDFNLNKSGAEIIEKQLDSNSDELKIIGGYIKEQDIPLSAYQIYQLQPSLRQVISSNDLIVSNDLNYRKYTNSRLDTSHSLYCSFEQDQSKSFSSLRDYNNFIEAVSCFSYGGLHTTYGFLHTINTSNEIPYQIEYPLVMVDQQIIQLQSKFLKDILEFESKFKFNHDLWHHILPVYADHFIIQHPDAPITYGGYLNSYQEFGKGMRKASNDYEIGLGICQRMMIESINEHNPGFKNNLQDIFIKYIDNLNSLLEEQHHIKNINNIIEHLTINGSNRFLTLFSFHELEKINTQMDFGISKLLKNIKKDKFNVKKDSIQQLLISIGIIKNNNKEVGNQIQKYKNTQSKNSNIMVIQALEELGLIDDKGKLIGKILTGLQILRWLSIIYPQRKSIQGFTERVQSNYIKFNNIDIDPRALLSLQYKSILEDFIKYNQRSYLRNKQQSHLYSFYKIIETLIDHIHNAKNTKVIQRLVIIIDKKIDGILNHNYHAFSNSETAVLLKSKKIIEKIQDTSLYNKIHKAVMDFNYTMLQSNNYMLQNGVIFKYEKKKILKNLMSL